MTLKSTLHDNKLLLGTQLFLFVLGLYPLLAYNKVNLFLQLNSYHHYLLDYFFYYITFFGGPITYAVLVGILTIMKQDRHVLFVGIISFVIMSILVQGLKSIEFFGQARPITLMSTGDISLHLVEGMAHAVHRGFPSGHSATIFAAVWLIHLQASTKPWWLSLGLCLVACLIAYSRVYLCQHFYRDIYVGALIGTVTTIVVHSYLKYRQHIVWLN